jgi:hypothetical protein
VKDQLAAAGRGIDGFLQALEANASLFEFPDCFDEMFQGASQSIKSPDDDDVTFSPIIQCGLEFGPLFLGTASSVVENLLAPIVLMRATGSAILRVYLEQREERPLLGQLSAPLSDAVDEELREVMRGLRGSFEDQGESTNVFEGEVNV